MRIDVLGVGFDNLTMTEAVERGMELVRSPGPHYVVTPNPEIVEVCRAAGKTSKVIFENCYLTDDEKKILCEIALPYRERISCCRTASASSRARPCWGRL